MRPKSILPPEVEAWVIWVRRAHKLWCKQIHKFHTRGPGYWNLSQESMIAFSERLSLIGDPDAKDAQVGFQQLQTLIFCRQRLDWSNGESIRKAVDALPTTRPELMRVVAACEAAERIEPLATARFSLPTFIEAALKIPTGGVTGFVDRLLNEPTRTNKTIRSIFCSGTVAYWALRLRGVFPTYGTADESVAYMEQVRQKIKTIT